MIETYNEIKESLKKQIITHLAEVNEQVDVYGVPYQNIASFPAVAIELQRRRKPKKAVGVRELQMDFVVWVYCTIFDYDDAEAECLRIAEIVEEAIEKDKTLNGSAQYLSVDADTEFGAVQQGDDVFYQGAQIRLTVTKRIRG